MFMGRKKKKKKKRQTHFDYFKELTLKGIFILLKCYPQDITLFLEPKQILAEPREIYDLSLY